MKAEPSRTGGESSALLQKVKGAEPSGVRSGHRTTSYILELLGPLRDHLKNLVYDLLRAIKIDGHESSTDNMPVSNLKSDRLSIACTKACRSTIGCSLIGKEDEAEFPHHRQKAWTGLRGLYRGR